MMGKKAQKNQLKARERNFLEGFDKRGFWGGLQGRSKNKILTSAGWRCKAFPYKKSVVPEKLPGYAKEIIKILILRYC
jgi:hypothetical protein